MSLLRLEEFAERTKKEAEERRKTRDAEGGRGGGPGHPVDQSKAKTRLHQPQHKSTSFYIHLCLYYI